MKTFPMFLKLAGRRVVIFGGGEQAAQKTRLMLKTEAEIVVVSATLDPELAALADAGRIRHVPDADGWLDGAALAFVATGDPEGDARLAAVARSTRVPANVVDAPDLCDAFTPSIVDRDPLVVAIGTEGAAPVLARQVKTAVEAMLEPRLGDLVALAGWLRAEVAARIPPEGRRAFWSWVFTGPPRQAHARGAEREAAQLLKDAIAGGGAAAPGGLVSLVDAGPGARDLITLRGVQRLQEADLILHDRLADPGLLELARRDAERVEPADAALMVEAARAGRRVVRLTSGAPSGPEIAACEAAGIAWEIVPDVPASAWTSPIGQE